MLPLLMADVGSEQIVRMVKGDDRARAFIQKIELAPGAKVTVVSAHGGDMIVMVKDVRIALTREMAARIMVTMRKQPLGKPHHSQRFAAALCVPDDAALVLGETHLRPLNAVILVIATNFLDALVKDDEVLNQVDKALFIKHGVELAQELIAELGAFLIDADDL